MGGPGPACLGKTVARPVATRVGGSPGVTPTKPAVPFQGKSRRIEAAARPSRPESPRSHRPSIAGTTPRIPQGGIKFEALLPAT